MRLPQVANPRPRKQIGFIEEYSVKNGEGYYEFSGSLTFPGQEPQQATGAANAVYFKLEKDLIVGRGMSRKVKIKAGSEVCRRVYPLEGRAV
ncbi:MAG: hypothetical protein KGL39_45680 [Patescibacteria group bacterium]|nr:hypothetical protein [Patescibacteria group bacterium]